MADRNHSSALLTPSEAAAEFGVTAATVRRWAKTDRISAVRTLGGQFRYRRAEIERLLAENPEHAA